LARRGDPEQGYPPTITIIFERLKLTLHPEKTRKTDLTEGREGFDFLGKPHARFERGRVEASP
jgi:hypothetical protein